MGSFAYASEGLANAGEVVLVIVAFLVKVFQYSGYVDRQSTRTETNLWVPDGRRMQMNVSAIAFEQSTIRPIYDLAATRSRTATRATESCATESMAPASTKVMLSGSVLMKTQMRRANCVT